MDVLVYQWNVWWHRIVRRPVTFASMRSRHTGHVGSSIEFGGECGESIACSDTSAVAVVVVVVVVVAGEPVVLVGDVRGSAKSGMMAVDRNSMEWIYTI